MTDIWVNGSRLTPTELATAAIKDPATGLWNLKIPVKLAVGGQSLNVTIFGGGAQCPDTATTCSSGLFSSRRSLWCGYRLSASYPLEAIL